MARPSLKIANAPVSYGAFELTVGRMPNVPEPDEVLDAVADAGYDGIDLGPLGYLGDAATLPGRLRGRGLQLVGGYVPLHLTDARAFEADLDYLQQVLDLFDAVVDGDPGWRPKPTLADAGSGARAANPGRGKDLPEIRLDTSGWDQAAELVTRAVDRCAERGYEATFHHHACSYVEAPQEIETLLERTEVGLCLDTGHLLLGGGDPLDAMEQWAGRINHIQIKDVRLDVVQRVIDDRAGMVEVWSRGAFCELGSGDLDVDGFLAALTRAGYQGWLMVEQDRILAPGEPVGDAMEAQRRNREFLRSRGF